MTGAEIVVTGTVQGVGYRWFCHRHAVALGLSGWVKNSPDGAVVLNVEGPKDAIEELLALLRVGPTGSQVANVAVRWTVPTGNYSSFEIAR